MPKGFVTKINKPGATYNETVAMRDSLLSTSYAIHSSIDPTDNYSTQQHVMQLCPNHKSRENSSPISVSFRHRSRSRSRSGSPANSKSRAPPQNWSTTLKTRTIYHNCNHKDKKCEEPLAHNGRCQTYNPVNVEKANSCPDRCACLRSRSLNNRKQTANSYNALQCSNSSPIDQRIVYSEEMVSDLKNELEKVKSHLEQIENKPDSIKQFIGEHAKWYYQMKAENKLLRRELDQKKKMYIYSVKEVEKARDILSEYENKVILLHQQAVKSSKVMKLSKGKFCKYIKEKEDAIKELKKYNETLQKTIHDKELQYEELNKTLDNLQGVFCESSEQFSALSENNKNFSECVKLLEKQLQVSMRDCEQYKEDIKKMEQQMVEFKCALCEKLEAKANKHKEKYEARIKELEEKEQSLKNDISVLTSKADELEEQRAAFISLQNKCNTLQAKMASYEEFAANYEYLEQEYQLQCRKAKENEEKFERERTELRTLVDELTNVVKENKVTLLQLSNMNKQQEAMLTSQSAILSEKEDQIKYAESEIEMLQQKGVQLEHEIDALRRALEGPCSKEACVSLSNELQEARNALSVERDNKLLKEKIIEDQTQTITCLQYTIKDKMSELSRAREESQLAEEEIMKINNHLMRKQQELDKELSEKEYLTKKLKKLDYQKSALSNEMYELEKLLDDYCDSNKYDANQQSAILELQKQVAEQRREWEIQKNQLAEEKEKAVSAAKFATQKLLDTVADFQNQVVAQKKVQFMLTKMLHDKEEELRVVQNKISSINSLTANTDIEFPLDEIYRRNLEYSNPATTTTSFYSSCSNCSKKLLKTGQSYPKNDLQHLFNVLTRTDEEPIRDC